MSELRHSKSDILIGGGLLAFCAFAAWRTLLIRSVHSGTVAGPSFVPWLMIGAVGLLALGLVARGVRQQVAAGGAVKAIRPEGGALVKIVLFAILLTAYAAAFYPVGYIPSTLVTFVAGLWLLGERKILQLLVFPCVMTLGVYYAFTELLSVWLP
ncbi:tripartite tricarboxylate transporter TctB family protein [Breoghania sp.]|uniref:tripartite tricarboxylate transporter TctB family protein n=1 Tax=Breoghania sp. TaxID=2065378 RepID=UPI002AA668F9|nr:tripartite tricarboxylate transporter TctB family protein [Breoghania sp.]